MTIRLCLTLSPAPFKTAGLFHARDLSDGIQALDCIRAKHYDTIISDVNMPGMNGLQLLTRVVTHLAPCAQCAPSVRAHS